MARQWDPLASLAANIRRLRETRGWTQEQLAEQAGLATRYVQTLESSSANPRASVIVAIADALAVDVAHLFEPAELESPRRGRPLARREHDDG